jgi:rubrerythrin
MAEAAYRTTVLAAGKKQKKLSVGWEVLGLDKDIATQIFEAESGEGFKTEREIMYGGQSRKYDKKGNILDVEGKIADPENAIGEADDDDDALPASNVYECGECGYTLFIAKGREFKFFGDDFKCPECGAAKDKFNARDMTDDE